MEQGGRILIIDFSNFEDYPIGGYLSFASNLVSAFGSTLALVGITTDPGDPTGRWFKKSIRGETFDFFAFARYKKTRTKHLIPDRLITYLLIRFYRRRIEQIGIRNLFIQRQEVLLAIETDHMNICFSFAGLENPLSISKYWYSQLIARPFEGFFFKKLERVQVILARGDDRAIADLMKRSCGVLSRKAIVKFPTRINTDVFKPLDKTYARAKLGLPVSKTIVVTTGRLAKFKGWEFMLECFQDFCKISQDSILYFVGEGEDSNEIKAYISECNLEHCTVLIGKKSQLEIALYLNAADLYIMGSFKEGWSTSLMEAIACGVPACVTDFSSSMDIVIDGENGFVVKNRDKTLFADCMNKALSLPRPVKNVNVLRYSTHRLKDDILSHWQLL